ncbi:hypothetical protein [Tenacibaculum sp.]|uniref:hypothetical protein n=1 Tax=Tenacibaculum sp. TaxID=1906242 RepID=UPI003D0B6462
MIIQVVNEYLKKDVNGKQYKYLDLYSPEYSEVSPKTSQIVTRPSKRCGYITYPVDYTDHQGSDPGSELCQGDEVSGYIVSVRVKPYWIGKEMYTKCSIPVFCTKEDPIEFEIALERAVIRAGKEIDPKELNYGGIETHEKSEISIPPTCLVVKTIKHL